MSKVYVVDKGDAVKDKNYELFVNSNKNVYFTWQCNIPCSFLQRFILW